METLTLKQTAAMIGISRRTLWKSIKEGGNHPPFQLVGKRKRFFREEVERWMSERHATSGTDNRHV